jgi:hypothetical protein
MPASQNVTRAAVRFPGVDVLGLLSANFHSIVRESGRIVIDQRMIYNCLGPGESLERILGNGQYAHDRP